MVVDDNKEIIMYIKNSLQLKFEVISAKNGEEGLKKAIRSIPNIILCDINMPVMDGIELTKRIKGNELTNHIPVILLTAYTSEESQIDAYSYGADGKEKYGKNSNKKQYTIMYWKTTLKIYRMILFSRL